MPAKKSAVEAEVKIENGVPIPSMYRSGKWNAVVQKMKVGDSVRFNDHKQALSLIVAVKRLGFKAVTRTVDGGVRVWKTEKKPA